MTRCILPPLAMVLVACSKPEPGPSSTLISTASVQGPGTSPHDGHADHREHNHPAAHADHDARHGGVVTMENDNHVEIVVGADGKIDLYVSDSVRKPIPTKDISGTITVESGDKKETLVLGEDVAKGAMSATGPLPNKTMYTWSLQVRGTPMKMSLEVPSGGTASLGSGKQAHGQAGHAHGSPHGGIVEVLGEGHAETKLDKNGHVSVWLLDSAEKPRSAKGATATIRPVLAGAKEVALTYDAPSDTLRGKVDPLQQEQVDMVLTVTPPGGTATAVRFKFRFAGKAHGDH